VRQWEEPISSQFLHRLLKLGTLNNILSDIAEYLEMSKKELIEKLFG